MIRIRPSSAVLGAVFVVALFSTPAWAGVAASSRTDSPASVEPVTSGRAAAPRSSSASAFWVYTKGHFAWPGDYSYAAVPDYHDRAGLAPGGFDDIKVSLTGQWGGWQPYSRNWSFNSRPYDALTFSLKPTVAGQRWSCQFVKIHDVPVGISLNVANYGPKPVAGHWATYTIPLAALGVLHQPIYKFAIQDQTGRAHNVWYVNDVGFVR